MKKCIIIGAGEFSAPKSINEGDLIIVADGGYDHAMAAGSAPHLFIGDMDSLTSDLPEKLEKITFPERKESRILIDLLFPTEWDYGFHIKDARITKVSDTELEGYADCKGINACCNCKNNHHNDCEDCVEVKRNCADEKADAAFCACALCKTCNRCCP